MLKIFICITAFLFFFSSSVHPETIQLKSGRTIEGEVIERGVDYIRLDFQGITLTYYLDEIETIDGRPPAEEKESLSKDLASPHIPRLDRAELKKRLKAQLEELHYPEHTHPALKEKLIAFFERIDLPALQSKAQSAKDDPDKLKELAKEIGAIFEKGGFLDIRSPQPLIRLLVDSFGDDDMLAVIEESPFSQEEKEARKSDLYSCSAVSQLAGITLNWLDLSVKTLDSSGSLLLPEVGHVANYVQLNSREILLLDFLHQRFEIIDLDYWYKQEGEHLALKSQHRLSPERILKIERHLQQDIVPTQPKEILNLFFLTVNLTDHYSASGSIYGNRGNAYARKGDLNQAISDYNQALRINPNSAATYNNRGNVYTQKGDLNQAISDFNQALRITPNLVNAYTNRGTVYVEKGDLNQAISDFNQALRINPNFALAYTNRGVAYVRKGNLNQAISDFYHALRINPNYAEAYNYRGLVYFLQGNYTRAWEDVRRAQGLGYQVPPDFLSDLRRASGRER